MARNRQRSPLNHGWDWLLTQTRKYPGRITVSLIVLLAAASITLGVVLTPLAPWLRSLNVAGSVLGWLSIVVGWSLALLAWAHRKEARLNFQVVGDASLRAAQGFDGSLILGSQHSQPEWHLRHIRPSHVEFVWTPMVREPVQKLLTRFAPITRSSTEREADGLSDADAYDIEAVKRHCREKLQFLLAQRPAHRVCVDLTAGTSTMTIAGFQAAEELGVTSIYLLGQTRTATGIPIIDAERIDQPDEAKIIILSDHRG